MSNSKQLKGQQLVQFYRRFVEFRYGAKVKFSVPVSLTGEDVNITTNGCNKQSP